MTTATDWLDIAVPFIKAREGCELTAYRDVAGIWTIGYGATGTAIGPGVRWTQAQAEADLRRRLVEEFGSVVTRAVRVRLTPAQRAALVSLTYNIGTGAFLRSNLLRVLNTGDYAGTAAHFADFTKAHVAGQLKTVEGLIPRRNAEAQLFLTAASSRNGST